MGKVIDLLPRIKNKKGASNSDSSTFEQGVVNLSQLRDERIQEERREVRRTILTQFIALHAVIPNQGLLRVLLSDINERGLAFQIEDHRGAFNVGDPMELRIYLDHQTYFPIQVKVVHVQRQPEEGMIRHGCEFLPESLNENALHHFVGFLESVTAAFRKDHGDVLVSKINS